MRIHLQPSTIIILTTLLVLTSLTATPRADFTTSITQAWVCTGQAGTTKIQLTTLNPSTTVNIQNQNTGDTRQVTTDPQGQYTGRLQSFASPGQIISFQIEGQTNPAKDRTAKNCNRQGSGTILVHQYPDTPQEMIAFQNGDLDIVDWAIPSGSLEEWTDCNGFLDIYEQCYNPVTNPNAQVTLSTHVDLGMFEYDFNNWNFPTSNQALRQAIGYLSDRESIILGYAGGNAVPICAGTAAGQPGARDCVQLGYPTSYGELAPAKALQVLHEAGFVDTNGNGVLELPAGTDVPTLILVSRIDDPIRTGAGFLLENALENLPNSYQSKSTGATVTVCTSTPTCRFNVDHQNLDRRLAGSIVLRGPDWKDWHIYTGGWGLGIDPDHMFPLYHSSFAPTECGGAWTAPQVLNYPCHVDPTFDLLAEPLVSGVTYADILAAAQDVQNYAWGYSPAARKISGTMPTVPLYTFISTKAAWKQDYGSLPLFNPDGSRACWRGLVPQQVGTGLDNLASLTGLYLDNCKQTKPDYVSYRGDTRSTLDWGFKSNIQELNIVTSQWLWDILAMQQTYDSMLGRNPVNLREIIPALAESYGETTYTNEGLGREATVAVYKLRGGIMWNDGTPLTPEDIKFSIEYVRDNQGWNFPLVEHVVRIDVKDSQTLHVYFDNIGALFTQNVGFLPIIAKHVWCPSWPDTTTNCPYPTPGLFPTFDFTKHVGTGPYMITGCTGPDCSETITLKPNPYHLEGRNYWSLAAGISLQPDLNGDDRVNSQDLELVTEAMSSTDPLVDVDYRLTPVGTQSFPNALGTGTLTVTLTGVQVNSIDKYIIERLISESADPSGIFWPPRGTTYTWPDVDRDNDVDLDDMIRVYLSQFQSPLPASQFSIHDVDYDTNIDLDDLILTFLRQFTRPPGAS